MVAETPFAGEGTVTILFTDVEGSTGLGARTDDESARDILRSQEEMIRAQLTDHGGRQVKNLGDGLMIAFSSARRALTCAVAIQKEFAEKRRTNPDLVPRVRMGLNSGEAIHEDGDLFGSAVSAAARISAHAAAGTILVSEVVKVLAGNVPGVTFTDKGLVELRGFDDQLRLFEIGWGETRSDPFLDRTPFVGREHERAELRSYLDRLADGRGGLVALGGEPGVGKTRLAEEILVEARARGYRTLIGRCYEMDSPPSYLPFVELLEQASREVDPATFRLALGDSAGEVAKVMPQLRNIFDDLPAALELPPEQERRYLFNSIQDFVHRAASVTPLVVLLDDVHWADESSILLLQHIAGTLPDAPVFLIGTYRDVELDTARPLAGALDSLVRRRIATRVNLHRLSSEGTVEMLAKLAGSPPPDLVSAAIYEETDGNAFFIEEVFRHLSEEGRLLDASGAWRTDLSIDELEVPEGVRLVIGRRLERLKDTTLKALTTAAVIGRIFSFELLDASDPADAEELLDGIDEAVAGHLIAPTMDGSFGFIHELIRQTLLSRVSMPRRQRLHLRVGEAMTKLYEGREDVHAAEITHHLFQAGAAADPVVTARFMILAGDKALEAAAFEDALRFYEEALALHEGEVDKERADLLFKVGSARRSLGRVDDGLDAWREAFEFYERTRDREGISTAAAESALQLGWAGRWAEAFEMCARGLSVLGDERTSERARLLSIGAIQLSWAGQHDAGDQMIDAALELSESLGDPRRIGEALVSREVHEYGYMRLQASVDVGARAAQAMRDVGDLWGLCNALAFQAPGHMLLLDLDAAERVRTELAELAGRLGHGGGLLFAARVGSFMRVFTGGDVAEWRRLAERDLEICAEYELPWISQSYIFLGYNDVLAGQIDEGLERLRIATDTEPLSALQGWALGTYFWAASFGRPDLMDELEPRVIAELPVAGEPNTYGRWILLHFAAEAYARTGNSVKARELYPLVEESRMLGVPIRFDGRPLAAIAGLMAQSFGDLDLARKHFEDALAVVEPFPLWPQYWDTRLFFAELLASTGTEDDRARARTLIDGAVSFAEKLGAPPMRARAAVLETALAQ